MRIQSGQGETLYFCIFCICCFVFFDHIMFGAVSPDGQAHEGCKPGSGWSA